MYIEPNSTVWLCKNIPFNNNYESTMYFETTVDQFAYFTSADKVVAKFEKQSYVRPTGALGGTIDVKELADNLYNVNYMVFQNTNFGVKWFYAFVTNVEYINNRTTRITFEIDVMQTWRVGYDYSLNECFVEREHSATDEIGDNLIDEGLELGDYFYTDLGQASGYNGNYKIVVSATFTDIIDIGDGSFVRVVGSGGLYGGVYSGLTYNVFDEATEVDDWLYNVTEANHADGVLNIFMIPSAFLVDKNASQPTTIIETKEKYYSDISGYNPKNKKLFTYPYNMLCVSDNNGTMANFAYEYFNGDNCQFSSTLALACTPEAELTPMNYKGITGKNYNERLILNNFPQCAYNIDSYRAWVAQNAIPMTANVLAGAVMGGVTSAVDKISGGTSRMQRLPSSEGGGYKRKTYKSTPLDIAGSVVGGIASAVFPNIVDNLSQAHVASTLPPQSRGSQTSVINMATKTQGFRFYRTQIRAEYARIIDDFFQKYGYATKRVKVPNVNVREHWTYAKTIGCTINGALPADDETAICAIFDSGITFFKDEASFTQQSSLYNRPLSEVNVSG